MASLYHYTDESVLEALSATPELAFFIKHCTCTVIVYNDKKIQLSEYCVIISHFNLGPKYPEYCEKSDSEALFSYARLISTQLRTMSIDTSKLVRQPNETPILPKWLQNTLYIGAIIGIKYICSTIGSKIDLPDFGGDNSNNGSDINLGNGFDGGNFGDSNGFVGVGIGDSNGFDGGGFGDGNGSDGGGLGDGNGFVGVGLNDGYGNGFGGDGLDGGDGGIDIRGFAFQGKHFDGYVDLNKTISVPTMGGGGNDTLHVYRKHGSSTIFLSDGDCYPVPILGHVWIKVGSHKFEVSKIKSKL